MMMKMMMWDLMSSAVGMTYQGHLTTDDDDGDDDDDDDVGLNAFSCQADILVTTGPEDSCLLI